MFALKKKLALNNELSSCQSPPALTLASLLLETVKFSSNGESKSLSKSLSKTVYLHSIKVSPLEYLVLQRGK